MGFNQEAKFVWTCCIFFIAVSAGQYKYSGTKFTKVPPKIIFAEVGSDAKFHWRFSFAAGSMNRSQFEYIIWGMSDGDKLQDKYITVFNDGKRSKKNPDHSEKERQRWGVSGNITETETNQVFVLKNVTKSDTEKTYCCKAIVWGEWFVSGPIHLQLKDTPKPVTPVPEVPASITIRTNERNVKVDERVELQCDASGEPAPFVEWSKEGVLKQNSTEKTSLVIPKVSRFHAGTYVCKATNTGGSVKYSVTLWVGS